LKMPLDLSMLAREELMNQFKAIYSEWEKYSGYLDPDTDTLLTDDLYENISLGYDIEKYIPTEFFKDNGIVDLREVIKFLKRSETIDLRKLAGEIASKEANNVMGTTGEIAPKEVTPILKFIETVVPPHIVRATGHLQWSKDMLGRVGITFEFVELGSQRNLMIRTIWWQSSEKRAAFAGVQPPSELSMADEVIANEAETNSKQATLPNDDEISLTTDRYIALLGPAMRWLALMFWEQRMALHVPFTNRVFKNRDKRFQAQILYLLGVMYYACAYQFQAYSSFFHELANEHFRQASTTDSSWGLPYLYLANYYSFKAQEAKGIMREKLLNEALSLYDKALYRAEARGEIYTQVRIIIAKALTELVSGVQTKDERLIDKAIQEVEVLKTQIDPADFDPCRADCAAYLYNLAIWHELAYDHFIAIPNRIPREEARLYLAYCLARSQSLLDVVENDANFRSMREEGDLEKLKEELDMKLTEKPELAKMTGENFKTEINNILEKVDQRLGRPGI
jgi:hypothetical protein